MFYSDLYVYMCTHTQIKTILQNILCCMQNAFFVSYKMIILKLLLCVVFMCIYVLTYMGVHGCEYVHLNLWQGPGETLRCSALPSSALVHRDMVSQRTQVSLFGLGLLVSHLLAFTCLLSMTLGLQAHVPTSGFYGIARDSDSVTHACIDSEVAR